MNNSNFFLKKNQIVLIVLWALAFLSVRVWVIVQTNPIDSVSGRIQVVSIIDASISELTK